MIDFVTEQIKACLRGLQTVPPHDYSAAYHAAYSGIHGLDPRRFESHAELIYGRSLGLEVWTKRQAATNDLRHAA